MEQRGERGPRGDHGQTGDEGEAGQVGEQGKAGRTGEAGDVGRTGRAGKKGAEGQRGRANWLAYVMMGAAMVVALVIFQQLDQDRREADRRTVRANQAAIAAIKAEGATRRDQTCLVFERDTVAAVAAFADARERRRRTLTYLASLPPEEARTVLNRTIRQGLPELRAEIVQKWEEARAAAAPPYCDRPGFYEEQLYKATKGKDGKPPVGMPEPNPKLPEKPKF